MIILIILLIQALLLFHYLYFLEKIEKGLRAIKKDKPSEPKFDFVSVIVPFRNEEDNILQCYESLKAQDFPKDKFEVIFVDDNSEDNSYQLLQNSNTQDNFRIIQSPEINAFRGHKKRTIAHAIENSRGDVIISTDADCLHNKNWLKEMINYFDENTAFVSGPVEFSSNGNIFNELQKLEFSSLILVGAGLIGINQPIICNAANLGYRKNVYDEVGGFKDNLNISSGDDEFLMQKIANNTDYKIRFCYSKVGKVSTLPNSSLREFYQQRKRWASKGFHYSDKKITLLLTLIFLFYISFPLHILLTLFFNSLFFQTFLIIFTIKFIAEYKIVMVNSTDLFVKSSKKYFLLAEILHVPYIIISGISGLFGNYNWKDRKVSR